jgi:uncharacterized protein (DUF58 family)
MQPTRRFRATVAVGGILAVAAVVYERPLLLVGAAGVGAWLLAVQVSFLRLLRRLDADLAVDQAVTPGRVATDRPADLAVTARLARPSPLSLAFEVRPPIPLRTASTDRALALAPGDEAGQLTVPVEPSVAGAFEVPPVRVTARDPFGLFEETIERGPSPTLRVDPRAPRNVHVGQGGEQVATAYGEHDAGRLGSGLEPAELRQYVPGDAASHIDWNATARLAEPHVREYEAETDRETVLVVDQRASMGVGPNGETALAYAREVALGFLARARAAGDPLGLYAVGDDGVTERSPPSVTPDQYARLRTALADLAPTDGDGDGGGVSGPATVDRSPAAARDRATLLDDDSAFARTLAPYFADTGTYVERVADDPLFATVETFVGRLQGTVWTVILTDDRHRAELREAVKVARRGDDRVLVFLAPSVLFDADGLADLDRAYERYRGFEEFRRDLDGFERVTAFEVAPGDRLQAVLSARTRQRAARGDD